MLATGKPLKVLLSLFLLFIIDLALYLSMQQLMLWKRVQFYVSDLCFKYMHREALFIPQT